MTQIAPQDWLQEPATRALLAALAGAGIAVRFVGGCVRDALLGRPPDEIADIDLATPARPEEVAAALAAAGIKTVPTGIAHGTLTAVVPPRHYEITTLRRDVETDGRRARVAFDADWAEDAARRDFTINAIYLDPDGTLHDPVGGIADLEARRVRFVGEPARRISEDVLRILRYYRFEARFGVGSGKKRGDPAARAACRAAAALLRRLSAERVAQELLRLLAVADPVPVLRMMGEDGVLAAALPEATRIERLQRLIRFEPVPPDPLRRLAALVAVDADGAAALVERLRLSNAQHDRLVGMAPPWPLDPGADDRAQRLARYRLGEERYRDLVLLVAAEDEGVSGERVDELLLFGERWKPPRFPLAGRDVTALGIPAGPRVGARLAAVRAWWEEGDFAADRAACLQRLRELAKRLD
ncbi:MAG TPA: CCA tRNA nucleotidyltransferase [Stellaceae bacterium]|nr:CCA tRNA nucleotidyltransferase [Stellaceae bacterium]